MRSNITLDDLLLEMRPTAGGEGLTAIDISERYGISESVARKIVKTGLANGTLIRTSKVVEKINGSTMRIVAFAVAPKRKARR